MAVHENVILAVVHSMSYAATPGFACRLCQYCLNLETHNTASRIENCEKNAEEA
ncbi:MAG: hypothetical protein WCV50_04425 [Patescibacteria group bacterium]